MPPQPAQPQPQVEPQKSEPSVLILKDGERIETRALAFSGSKVWIVDGQITRQIALSDVDRAGTEKANRDRGVRLAIPTGSAAP
jgi:hypothetical protein